MKTRVKITDELYSVDRERGVVVCILKCDLQLEKSPADSVLSSAVWHKKINVDWAGNFVVKGIARCHPDDKFNEKIGKRIAESKAKYKAFKTARRFYSLILSDLAQLLNDTQLTLIACAVAEQKEINHLQKLIRDDNIAK